MNRNVAGVGQVKISLPHGWKSSRKEEKEKYDRTVQALEGQI